MQLQLKKTTILWGRSVQGSHHFLSELLWARSLIRVSQITELIHMVGLLETGLTEKEADRENVSGLGNDSRVCQLILDNFHVTRRIVMIVSNSPNCLNVKIHFFGVGKEELTMFCATVNTGGIPFFINFSLP